MKRYASILALLLVLVTGSGVLAENVPVLMYHRITCAPTDAALPQLWVCPGKFRKTIQLLTENGWKTMTSAEVWWRIKNDLPIPPKTYVIVIDDGASDGYDNAFPALQEFGQVAVFAVVAGRVDVTRWSFTWAQLMEMVQAGSEVASHTITHADVSRLDADSLIFEIEQSGQVIAEHMGKRPKTFVYPFGLWDQQAANQVKASGFRVAYTTVYGCTLTWSDRLVEERIRVNRSDDPQDVLRKMRSCA